MKIATFIIILKTFAFTINVDFVLNFKFEVASELLIASLVHQINLSKFTIVKFENGASSDPYLDKLADKVLLRLEI